MMMMMIMIVVIVIVVVHLCGLVVRVPGFRHKRSQFRFLVLPDFLRGIGSGMGSNQSCGDN
jgi:hypothetical protein